MWYVYILKCRNGSLYTGITSDLKRRFKEHLSGKGAKFTRAFGAVEAVYCERRRCRSRALVREAQIKKLTRAAKLELIRGQRRKAASTLKRALAPSRAAARGRRTLQSSI